MEKRVALFEVKALGDDTDGEFEAILSVPTIDRDGEVIDGKAFEPLPAEIPIHKFHDFSSPVATATPFYEGDVLKARGTFDPDPASQEIRSKVGRSIKYMSVGFMAATRSDEDGVPHITKAELLEASFVSVPSNREAAILAVKSAMKTPVLSVSGLTLNANTIGAAITPAVRADLQKAGARNSTKDSERLQTIHDLAVQNGAKCASDDDQASPTTDPEKAAAPAAAPLADVTVGKARLAAKRAEAELLLLN